MLFLDLDERLSDFNVQEIESFLKNVMGDFDKKISTQTGDAAAAAAAAATAAAA